MAVEIVDFPIKNCDFPWLCDSLPEGNVPSLGDLLTPWQNITYTKEGMRCL